ERGADLQFRERLWREARAVAAVNHPNICQIYEIAEEDGVPFLVMELLEGEALSRKLRRGPMPLEEAVSATLEMLSALDALHSIVYGSPAALSGPALRLEAVLSRALAKKPTARYASAEAMASDLRLIRWNVPVQAPSRRRTVTRLIVLPFQELRRDEETGFLC